MKLLRSWLIPLALLGAIAVLLAANLETLVNRYFQQKILAAATGPGWVKAAQDGFVVHYPEGDDGAAEIMATLPEARRQVEHFFGPLPDQIAVVIFPDLASMSAAVGYELPSYGVGGYMLGMLGLRSLSTWPVEIRAKATPLQIVTHELAHLATRKVAGHVPAWLNEGLAQWVAGQVTPERESQMKALAASGNQLTLERIDQLFRNPATQDETLMGQAYLQSGSFVAHLAETYGPDRLRLLLDAMGKGRSLDQAVQSALGKDLPALEAAWLEALTRQ